MSLTRETYYGALYALLSGIAAFRTIDRRVRFMEEMGDAELPALFMAVGNQKVTTHLKTPPVVQLGAKLFLYCANPDQHTSADIALNGLVDQVGAALAPAAPYATQTLGGLVQYCWITGDAEFFAAPNGERAAAILPVEMLVAE